MNNSIDKIRVLNIIVFILLQLVRLFEEFYILSILLTYLHILACGLFLIIEVISIIIYKKTFFKQAFYDWKFLIVLMIIVSNVITILLNK